MARAIAVLSVALAMLLHGHATATTLRGSPTDMIELQAVDGGVYVRDTLAVYSEPGTPIVDCELGDWEPESDCNAGTLTQIFVRKATIAPGGDGAAACEDVRETRKCKPVHCEMGPWTLWSDCEEGGYKTRTREQLQGALYGGRSCPHEVDRVKCRPEDCLVCGWSDWKCDPKTEKKTRTRIVTRKPQLTGKKCPRLEDEADCDPIDCVLDDAYEDEWTECDAKGDRHKYRKIKVPAQYKGAKACPPPEDVWMTEKGACPPVDCEEVDESTVAFGECEKKEGTINTWVKRKVIDIKTFPRYGGTQCRSESERTVEVNCDPVPCVMSEWQFEGDCRHDGRRWRTRKVVSQGMYGASECKDEEEERPDPKSCPPVDCEEEDEGSVRFGECGQNEATKQWTKRKVISIKTLPKYGGQQCRSERERTVELVCDPEPCVMDEWQFQGDCKENGQRKRTRKVVIQAKYGAPECIDEEDAQPDPETCPPVDCVEEDEDGVQFGKCKKNDSDTDWFRTKLITIKTFPIYGGAECRSEEERTVTEICPPEDCVYSEWEFSGECDRHGRRKRTRRVVTQAKFGAVRCKHQISKAKDPDACPRVDCEEYREDEVEFGRCQKNMETGTWVKKKVLGIKTRPQYGGKACRSKKERTVEAVCQPSV